MRVTAIQNSAKSIDIRDNLHDIESLINDAIEKDQPNMIVLPEMFASISWPNDLKRKNAEDFSSKDPRKKPIYTFSSQMAKKHEVYIHAGSICETSNNQLYNTTVVFSPEGIEIARYRKIHLLKICIGTYNISEDETYSNGHKLVTYPINLSEESFQIGCSICFDIRFPDLFSQLHQKGANIMMIPSAFLAATGQYHWETLCRARAIETQSYVIAPGQTGNINDRTYWGHSLIIDPWGQIIAQLNEEIGFITATISQKLIDRTRNITPKLDCQRL